MRTHKLTSRFQQALAYAQSIAVGHDHNMLEPAHLFAALPDQGGSTAPMLAQAGANAPLLRQRVGKMPDKLPRVSGQVGNINVSNELDRRLKLADKLAGWAQVIVTLTRTGGLARADFRQRNSNSS